MATASVTFTFAANTLIQASQANTNFADVVAFLNGSVIHKDATVAFTGVPSGPASDPVSANQFTRKSYVDAPFAYVTLDVSLPNAAALTAVGANWVPVFSRGVTATTSGFTITSTRTYIIGHTCAFGTSATGDRRNMAVRRNGAIINGMAGNGVPSNFSAGFGLSVACGVRPIALTAGDTIDCCYNQDTGAGLTANGAMWILGLPGV